MNYTIEGTGRLHHKNQTIEASYKFSYNTVKRYHPFDPSVYQEVFDGNPEVDAIHPVAKETLADGRYGLTMENGEALKILNVHLFLVKSGSVWELVPGS